MVRRPKSASPPVSTGMTGPQRLQRVLAAAGFGSRRQCEELIEAGRVHVDGLLVEKLGAVVDSEAAKILVDGQPLKRQKLVYYAVNKPVGVVTTNADPQGRPRVIDLVPPNERVFPVGRLDLSSEGLILLTNDGELAQRLAHPKFGIQKVYRVTVAGKVDAQAMRKMREGIYIAEGHVRVDGARVLKAKARSTEMEITLREGKNREIRRILARLGHKVQTLRRIAIGPLRLGEMPPAAYRPLTRDEIQKLQTVAAAPPPAPPPAAAKPEGFAKSDRSVRSGGSDKSDRSGAARRGTGKPTKTGKPAKSGTPARSGKPTSTGRPTKTGKPARSGTAARSGKPASAAKSTRPRKPAAGEIVIRLDREERTGAVIGGDPAPKPKPTKRVSAKSRKDNPGTKRATKKGASSSRPRSAKKRKR